MTVHEKPEKGFLKVIYQRALEIEMQLAGINALANMKCLFFTGIIKLAPKGLIISLKRKLALSQKL